MKKVKHPMQPVVVDLAGVYRFKENPIVRKLLEIAREHGRYGLNEIAMDHREGRFSTDDMVQFNQLIGYSVCGWGDLSFVSEKNWERSKVKIDKAKKRLGIKE